MTAIKLAVLICVTSLLNGCILFMLADRSPPPMDGWESFRMPKIKNISSEMIKQDMLACGFDSTSSTYIASNDKFDTQYINAVLCMESKGYQRSSLPKGVCYRYADKPACQAHQKKN